MVDDARAPEPHSHPSRDVVSLVGRSSSHFTRIVRIFAHECGVPYRLQVVPDLLATEPAAYGGNPGLRVPSLITDEGVVFGALNSCRVLARRAQRKVNISWPESVNALVAMNAQELVLQTMATEVTWVMSTSSGAHTSAYGAKLRLALDGMLQWVNAQLASALASLPDRDVSFLEVSLFCLLEHLEFRRVTSLDEYPELERFRRDWGQREAARSTSFCFDAQ